MDPTEFTLPQKVIDAIWLINHGDYFAAHEELEFAWREEPGSIRELYQGLLLVSVMNYHTARGNHKGAARLLTRSINKLFPFQDFHVMIDVHTLVHALQKLYQMQSESTPAKEMIRPMPIIMIPLVPSSGSLFD